MALFTRCRGRFSGPARAAAAGLLLVAVLLGLFLAGPLGPEPARAASTGELNQKLEDVRSELRQVRASLAKAEVARKAALGDIAALDQSIVLAEKDVQVATAERESAEGRLAALRAQLDKLTIELNSKRVELQQTEDDLAAQQVVYNTRVVNIYKSGSRLIYLAALLEPRSLEGLVGRLDVLSTVVDQDNTILGEIRTLRTQVGAQKRIVEESRAQVVALEQNQQEATKQLQARAEDLQASLDALKSALTAKKKVLAAAEEDQAAWSKQEDQLRADSDRIAGLLKAAEAAATAVAAKPVKTGSGVLAWPVNGEVSSGFGYRIHPIFHVRKMHTGIDISAGMGVSIRAASGGTVVSAGWRGGYGRCVVISHSGGLATLYAHQSSILVSVGDTVKRGEVIGKVGSTGYSTGPHLHFEVRVNGSPVDPMRYL